MREVDLLIHDGLIVTMNPQQPVIEHGSLAIDGGRILAVDSDAEIARSYSGRALIDAGCNAIIPGFVDTHHHFLQNFHKGARDDLFLIDWIDQVSVPRIKVAVNDYLGGVYDLQQHASRLGCVDAIKAGITTTINMEWATHPSVIDVFEQAGIRVVHTLTIADQWISPDVLLPHDGLMLLADELLERCRASENGRITFRYGLACSNSCSVELIKEVRKLADTHQVGIHIHIAEEQYESVNLQEQFGMTSAEHLHNLGLLGPDVLGAHCIWLSDKDIELFQKTETKVSHNPECNMKLAMGVAPIVKFLEAGVVVSLGTDTCAVNDNMDMFEAMRTAAFLQKLTCMDPKVLPAEETLRMATQGGAEALGMQAEIGSLEVGKKADVLLIDLTGNHMRPINKIENSLVYCASSHDVQTVICDGRVVMQERNLIHLDEDAWVGEAVNYAHRRFVEAGIELPAYYDITR
jgi:5-methylthioadenosine/S-adenosylhomocysteine deaminase